MANKVAGIAAALGFALLGACCALAFAQPGGVDTTGKATVSIATTASSSSEVQPSARAVLDDRLSQAVATGDLTDADRESVLKAFDQGTLGGGCL